jgi:hypothetical protein
LKVDPDLRAVNAALAQTTRQMQATAGQRPTNWAGAPVGNPGL